MASFPSIQTLAAGATISAFLLIVFQFSRAKTLSRCPRYPHWDPITGRDFRKAEAQAIAAGRKNAWHRENFAKYGKTYQVVYWGQPQIHTMDPIVLQSVLASNLDSFGVGPSRGPNAIPWLGKGILTTDGEYWQHSRDLVKPIFKKAQVSNLDRLGSHLHKMLRCIPSDGTTVDLQELFGRMYLDFATEFIFGESSNTLDPEAPRLDASKFIEYFDKSLLAVVYAQATPKIIRFLSGKQKAWDESFGQSQNYVDGFIDAAIERRRREEKNSTRDKDGEFVFLEELLSETGSTDRQFLRGQLMNIFYPSRETSASGISLVFFQLARHPEVWAKIRQETLNVELPITYAAVKSLHYTNAAVTEALRLFSTGSSPVRTALRDCKLPRSAGGDTTQSMYITKGTKIIMHTHAVQRDPNVWGADADQFRPERWLEGGSMIPQRRAWEYLPFSGGPRICPAAQMMNTHLAYIVAIMAREYVELQNRDPVEIFVEEHRVSLKSGNGVKVGLVRM